MTQADRCPGDSAPGRQPSSNTNSKTPAVQNATVLGVSTIDTRDLSARRDNPIGLEYLRRFVPAVSLPLRSSPPDPRCGILFNPPFAMVSSQWFSACINARHSLVRTVVMAGRTSSSVYGCFSQMTCCAITEYSEMHSWGVAGHLGCGS